MNNFFSIQSIFSRHSFIYENIPKTISLFYFCVTATSSRLYLSSLSLEQYDNLYPPALTFFIKYLPPEILIFLINITPIIFLITALLPRFQFLRVLSALFCIFSYGYDGSFGLNEPGVLIILYGTIALAFMPSLKKESSMVRRIDKHIRIFYFWVFHGALLMSYFVSGLTKLLYGGIYQLIFDDVSIWSPHAMTYVTEFYLWRIGSSSWLGDLIINYTWLSAPMYALATILEIFSLLPLFFPKLWKVIVLKLVLFHFLINWILNILFLWNILILLVVLYNTPFSYPLTPLKEYYIPIKSYFIKIIRGIT